MSIRPKFLTFTPANASLTGFASNVTGATWTLTTTETSDGLAHQVSIKNDTATDHSGKTVVLVGTDADGRAQTETISLPAGSATVESTYYYKTLTSATPSATIGADTMDIGWVDEFVTQTIPFNWRGERATIQIEVTGTINYTAQYTMNDIQRDTPPFTWHDSNDPNVVAVAVDGASNYDCSVMATRVKVNSYSSGATLKYIISQMDN